MASPGALIYGVLAYGAFLVAFLYAVGFVAGVGVPTSVDAGRPAPAGEAVLINLLLLGLFGLQHSIMARPAFKSWWTRFVPKHLERSTFVLATSLALGLIYWQWRALPEVLWEAEQPALRAGLLALSGLGWIIVLLSTFVIDHFDLFGLRQTYLYARGVPYSRPTFKERAFYRWVRHPLMLGFLIAFWATPRMTAGHLLFAAVTTGYILVAIQLEERDLVKEHGDAYRRYRERVSMLFPLPRRLAGPPGELPRAPEGTA